MINSRSNLLKIGLITNIFEVYDMVISGYLALIIGKVFFKAESPVILVLVSFILFAAAFLIRPLGGIFWGYIGDKYGSGKATKYSMLIMGLPPCILAVLPTYDSIGYLATFMLLALKLIQGFGASGQVPSNMSYIYEKTTNSWFCGMVACGGWVGSLLASIISLLLYSLFDKSSIYNWAWRLPFLLSIPMFIIIFYFRNNIEIVENYPLSYKCRSWLDKYFVAEFMKCFILLSFMQVSFYMLFVWMPTYLETFLHVSHRFSRLTNMIGLIIAVFSVAAWGYLGKFIDPKKLIIISILLLIVFSYPLFYLLQHASFFLLLIIQLTFVILYTPIEGSYVFTVGRSFTGDTRNMGMALGWNFSIAIFGGTTPLICSYFIHLLNFNMFPVFYLIAFGVITLPAVWLMK